MYVRALHALALFGSRAPGAIWPCMCSHGRELCRAVSGFQCCLFLLRLVPIWYRSNADSCVTAYQHPRRAGPVLGPRSRPRHVTGAIEHLTVRLDPLRRQFHLDSSGCMSPTHAQQNGGGDGRWSGGMLTNTPLRFHLTSRPRTHQNNAAAPYSHRTACRSHGRDCGNGDKTRGYHRPVQAPRMHAR